MTGPKPYNLVSVCIPTYNGESFIEETVRSVRNSTHQSIEIIIADDRSNDRTPEIIGRIKDGNTRLIYNKERLGAPANWNRALHKAKGDWICFLNQDDLISPFWISYALRILKSNPNIGWIVSSFQIIDASGKLLKIVSRFSENRLYEPFESFPVVSRLDGLGPGFVARKSILAALGFFDENMGPGADNELFLRLASRHNLFFSTTPHTSWRLHHNNLTHKWSPIEQAEDAYKYFKKLFSDPSTPMSIKMSADDIYKYIHGKLNETVISLRKNGELALAQSLRSLLDREDPRFDGKK